MTVNFAGLIYYAVKIHLPYQLYYGKIRKNYESECLI